MALTPWVTTSLKANTKSLRSVVDGSTNTSDPFVYEQIDLNLQFIAGAVSSRIETYAPLAPQSVRDQAMISGCGWLFTLPGGNHRLSLDGLTVERAIDRGRWFRLSAAASMLAPWRMRDAGVVEES